MKYEIKSRWDWNIIYADEAESFRALVGAAVKARANLAGANLAGAEGINGYFSFGPGGSRQSYTWARWEEGGYMVHCGCQTLTLADFKKTVVKTHGKSYHAKYYLANIKVMELVAKESKAAFKKASAAKEKK